MKQLLCKIDRWCMQRIATPYVEIMLSLGSDLPQVRSARYAKLIFIVGFLSTFAGYFVLKLHFDAMSISQVGSAGYPAALKQIVVPTLYSLSSLPLVVGALAWGLLMGLLIFDIDKRYRILVLQQLNRCTSCGYTLTGPEQPVCTECGKKVASPEPTHHQARS